MCKVRVEEENKEKVSNELQKRGFKFSMSNDTRKCYDCYICEYEWSCDYSKNNTCLLNGNKVMFKIENMSGNQFHKMLFEIGVIKELEFKF